MNTLGTNVLTFAARRHACAAVLIFGGFFALSLPCSGQSSNSGQTGNTGQLTRRTPTPTREMDPLLIEPTGTPIYYEKRLQMLNAAQHQSMVADTDRLLKLVAALNAQVNTSNSSALTPEQLRMVAEIEKLAHNVKDKMRMSVRSAVEFNGPTSATPFGPR